MRLESKPWKMGFTNKEGVISRNSLSFPRRRESMTPSVRVELVEAILLSSRFRYKIV